MTINKFYEEFVNEKKISRRFSPNDIMSVL